MGTAMTNESNAAVLNYHKVLHKISTALETAGRPDQGANLVAVSKTYDKDAIEPVLTAGHRIFGENRVQEAATKWPTLREKIPGIELHLIGPLQSNKSAEAVDTFDVIETVDREKVAVALTREMKKKKKTIDFYVQVNTGEEPQKAGIAPREASSFVSYCQHDLGMNIVGLMCIPPFEENPGPHFALLAKLARENGLEKLSMGMSADFETAIAFGATSVRVGSAIFGARK